MAIYTRAQQKHDIEANWIKAINFIPLEGEIIIYDADENYSYQRIKIGDGITKVNDLPFDNIQGDWNQNDETAPDYIKNRTHYKSLEGIQQAIEVATYASDWGSGNGMESALIFYNIEDLILKLNNSELNYLKIGEAYQQKITSIQLDEEYQTNWQNLGYNLYLENNDIITLVKEEYGIYECASPSDELIALLQTYPKAQIIFTEKAQTIKQLDEKYIPDTIARKSDITNLIDAAPEALDTLNELSAALGDDPNFATTVLTEIGKKVDKVSGKGLSTNDYTTVEKNQLATLNSFLESLQPIDLLKKLNIAEQIIQDWPYTDEGIVSLLQNSIQDYTQTELFELFHYFYDLYNNIKIMPIFEFYPRWLLNKDQSYGSSNRYRRLCSIIEIELDSLQPYGNSSADEVFTLNYYINFSNDNILNMKFYFTWNNQEGDGIYSIPWDDLTPYNGDMELTFSLILKGGAISSEQLITLAQEQIITPILTKEEF